MLQSIKRIFPRQKGAYIIGGSIRDLLLGRVPADYDIACAGNPEKFAKKILARSGGHFVRLGKSDQVIFRVISGGMILDIASLNGSTVEEDLKKRDFTVNAIAYDLYSEKIIDCLGGIRDLAGKTVRMVSNSIFQKDPVRLIRAYRIGACLNFKIEPRTTDAIARHVKLLKNIAGERIRTELLSMLDAPASYPFLTQMANNGLLGEVFPGFDGLKGCYQNNRHTPDLLEHTLKAFEHLEIILNKPGDIVPDISGNICRYIEKTKPAVIKCAVLIQDIGKPPAQTLNGNGKYRFYGHAPKSAQMAQTIGRRLRFSNREQQVIQCIVRQHMTPLYLFKAYEKKPFIQKGIIRFFKKCSDDTPGVLLAAMADTQGKPGKMTSQNKNSMSFLKMLMHDYFMDYQPLNAKPPLLTGHDLIDVFGLTPSPLFKKILDLVDDAKLARTVKSRSEALELAKGYLASIHHNIRG